MRQELSIIEIIFPYIRALLHTQAVYASTSHTLSFSYIFIGEANKNIDSAKDVRTKSEKTSAFEMVSTEVRAKLHFLKLSYGA